MRSDSVDRCFGILNFNLTLFLGTSFISFVVEVVNFANFRFEPLVIGPMGIGGDTAFSEDEYRPRNKVFA